MEEVEIQVIQIVGEEEEEEEEEVADDKLDDFEQGSDQKKSLNAWFIAWKKSITRLTKKHETDCIDHIVCGMSNQWNIIWDTLFAWSI